MKNYDQFVRLMRILGEVFDKDVSDDLLKIYWRLMKSHTDENFAESVQIHLQEGTYFPRPAELIRYMSSMPVDRIRYEANKRLEHDETTPTTTTERLPAPERVQGHLEVLRGVIGIESDGLDSQDDNQAEH